MARYTGPRLRKLRALDTDLPGLTPKRPDRLYPPGQHGPTRRRPTSRQSPYKLQLVEKQKLRFNYGLLEGQLRRLYDKASRSRGNTADELLSLLERRLDNVVFRAGFARSIPAARQLVVHGHVRVNGRKVDRPSFLVDAGMVINLREKMRDHPLVRATWARPILSRPDWLSAVEDAQTVKVVRRPAADEIPLDVQPQLVVEWYSR
jgi:small subunit ribosomal protein S4